MSASRTLATFSTFFNFSCRWFYLLSPQSSLFLITSCTLPYPTFSIVSSQILPTADRRLIHMVVLGRMPTWPAVGLRPRSHAYAQIVPLELITILATTFQPSTSRRRQRALRDHRVFRRGLRDGRQGFVHIHACCCLSQQVQYCRFPVAFPPNAPKSFPYHFA